MESQEEKDKHGVWEIYRREWETASSEKKVELNNRMNRWQELIKSGLTASEAYARVMQEELGEPPIYKTMEEESDDTPIYKAIEEESDYRVIEERSSKPPNAIMKLLKGTFTGGLYVGGGAFFIIFNIVAFAVPAVVGLSVIWLAIKLFLEGSIIWGLLVLLIGTPIAIGIAAYAAIFLFFIGIIALIIWGIISLFGFNVSFDSVWSMVWFGVKILFLGGIAFVVGSSFVVAVKEKDLTSFFKEYWFLILFFFFLFWLFF